MHVRVHAYTGTHALICTHMYAHTLGGGSSRIYPFSKTVTSKVDQGNNFTWYAAILVSLRRFFIELHVLNMCCLPVQYRSLIRLRSYTTQEYLIIFCLKEEERASVLKVKDLGASVGFSI